MYSEVVQRTLVYLKQLILKQGFLFSFFFCSWRDGAAVTFCFLTLACQRFVIIGDSIFAPSLPARIFSGRERLLTFRACLYGEENLTLLSRCSENCLFVQLESFSLTVLKSCVLRAPFPAESRCGGRAPCPSRSTGVHAVSLQSVT